MSLQKKPLKTKSVCKVTFTLPAEMSNGASTVHLAGDFNGWSINESPLKRKKDGSFSVTLDLEKDSEYQFRYILDQKIWENDDSADGYAPSPVNPAVENSVVRT